MFFRIAVLNAGFGNRYYCLCTKMKIWLGLMLGEEVMLMMRVRYMHIRHPWYQGDLDVEALFLRL